MRKGQMFSIREASGHLRVSLKQIYNLVWDGKLPAQKIDGQWRIPKSAVQSRLSQRGPGQ